MRAYFLTLSVICLAAVVLAGCGSGSSRAKKSTQADPEPEVSAGVNRDSGIPGLTIGDVNAMPEVPPLPSRFDHESTMEDVEAEAARVAKREESRKQLGSVSAEKRAIFLAHKWWLEVRVLQRGQPSEVPGLTIGEVEDQPTVPSLAKVYELGHTPADLRPHAVITALEEDDAGILGNLSVEARVIYLEWAWTPLLHERLERYQAAVDERQARANYQISEAKRKGEWKAKIKKHRHETDILIDAASRQRIPVLTEEEVDELDSIGAN